MRKAIKFLSITLMAVLAVSLMCACDSGNADGESSESPQSTSAASDNTTSAESNASNTNNSGSASSNESTNDSSASGEASADSDYEEMMSYAKQLSPELTKEEVSEILGEPDSSHGSGLCYNVYEFGKYTLEVEVGNINALIRNNETKECIDLY